jgi:hypothetical protein
MASVHDELRARLGSLGAWTFAFDAQPVADVRVGASALEELGYTPSGCRKGPAPVTC